MMDESPGLGRTWTRDGRLEASVAVALIVLVTAFHYLTDPQAVEFHNVYRRLYYVPIVLAAFSHGLSGGVMAGVAASLAYLPHAFFMEHRDPAPAIDKVLEMVLYVGIGGLTGWLVGRQRDIQRALERSLEERDALEESLIRAGKLSALGQMTSGLAHEIRNPLASIMGSAEALVDEFDEDHRKYRMGQVLLTEIERLNDVVEDFLEFARPGAPDVAKADLHEVTGEVVELTAPQARDAGVEVDVRVEPETWVAADPSQLSQVLLNFLLNAYQAFERGEPPAGQAQCVTVKIESRSVGDSAFVCLGVRDNAGALDSADVERIFDPYVTGREGGTGLGLSVSSRIIEAQDGFIDVDAEDEATTFWACIPSWTEDA
jgi:signal transduction histidine kinase